MHLTCREKTVEKFEWIHIIALEFDRFFNGALKSKDQILKSEKEIKQRISWSLKWAKFEKQIQISVEASSSTQARFPKPILKFFFWIPKLPMPRFEPECGCCFCCCCCCCCCCWCWCCSWFGIPDLWSQTIIFSNTDSVELRKRV